VYPQQPQSAFSFNFDPNILAQISANPNQNNSGAQNPSGFSSLSFNQPQANPSTGNQPPSVSPQNILSTGLQAIKPVSNPITGGVNSALNSFGTKLGFAGSSVDSAANLASFGVAPGASTEAAAAAADATASFAPGTSSLGASTFGGTLSGTLGAAGLGYLGGTILSKFTGGNPTGSGIGGAIGAAAGFAGAEAIGAMIGTTILPGVGSLVGGIGGALFGGMFGGGGSPATQVSQFDYRPGDPTSTPNYLTRGGASTNDATKINQGIQPLLQAASKELGFTIPSNISVSAGTNSLHPLESGKPGYIGASDGKSSWDLAKVAFNPSDSASTNNAYLQEIKSIAKASGYTDMNALESWFTQRQQQASGVGMEPQIPNNPKAQGPSEWEKFLTNYKAQQNANAAPTPTA